MPKIRNPFRVLAAAAAFGLASTTPGTAQAALYDSFLPITDTRSAANFNFASTHTFDGSTGYFIMRDVESSVTPTWDMQISKVTDVKGPGQTRTTLVSAADWLTFTGYNSILPGDRAAVVGSSLQFIDVSTDTNTGRTETIYRVHTTTGALSVLADWSDFTAATGQTNLDIRSDSTFDAEGNMYIYDDVSDQVLKVDTVGNVSVYINSTDLQTATGASLTSYVSGGMAFDSEGNFFWGVSNSSFDASNPARGNVYKRAADGTLSKAIEQSDIVSVSRSDPFFGANFAAINDMIFASDGQMYFYDRANDALLRFDPLDPDATLERILNTQELLDGPMSSENINSFGVFEQTLTWVGFVRDEGVFSYTIPTPSTGLMLGLASVAALARRRRSTAR